MQNAKSIIFFFLEILFRGTPSRAANRSCAKQPAVVSRSPIPAPWLKYRSPSGPVPHQFPVAAISSSSRQVAAISQVVAAREQQNPRYRIDEEGVPGRR